MRAVTCCPGTCGELFQGWPQGICQLVSCPIGLWSRLEVRAFPGDGRILVPDSMSKTERALKIALDLWDKSLDLFVSRETDLPGARGYASSTADILGVLYGLAACLGRVLTPEEATEIAVSVEPSDSLAWPGLVLMDHRRFSRHRYLGPVPNMTLALFDPGGEVDTVEFNDRSSGYPDLDYDRILWEFEAGLSRGDWAGMARASTDSALANQGVLPKSYLDRFIETSLSNGALGVVTAHSGTISGAIFMDCPGKIGAFLWPPELGEPRYVPMVSGGVRLLEVEL